MRDRWDRWGVGMLEAGWLACALIVPLLVSPSLSLAFTADKVLVFRCLMEVVGLIGLLLWLRRPAVRPQPVTLAIAAYAMALTLATLFGRNPSDGFWGSYLRLFGLFTMLHGGALYLIVAGCFRSERQWHRLLIGISLLSLVVCTHALIQWRGLDTGIIASVLSQPGFRWDAMDSERYRPFASIGNPSFLGSLLVFAIAFALGALITLPRGRRWPAMLMLGLLAFVLVVNQTRGAWLGTAAMLFVFALLTAPRMRRRGIAAAGAGTVVLALAAGLVCARSANAPWVTQNFALTRLAHFLQHDPNSSGWYRLDMWRRVGKDVAISPGSLLLGYGPSSYLLVASRSYVPAYTDGAEPAQFMDSTHNIFGDALVDSGLLGLAALAAILFLAFRMGLRGLRRAASPTQRSILITALTALVGYVVQGMFLFDHVITLIYLCLTLGLITAASRAGWGVETVTEPQDAGRPRSRQQGRQVRLHGLRVLQLWQGDLVRSLPAASTARLSRINLPDLLWRPSAAIAAIAFVSLVLLPVNLRAIRAQVCKREADVLTAAGRNEEATEALREACRLVPGERTYHVSLAASILAGQSVQVNNAEELRAAFQASERELLRAVRLDPGDVRTYWPLGQLYQYWGMLDRSKYADGERVYRQAAALSPRRQRTYWAWGDLLLAEGQPAGALDRYRYALALDPNVVESKRALAKLYVRMGQPDRAEPLFQDAWRRTSTGPVGVRERPASAAEHEMLGLAYLSRGQKLKARAYLTDALSLNPQLSQAREALEQLSRLKASG